MASSLLAVIVVIIIVAAAGAGYFALAGGKGSSTTPSGSGTPTTSSSSTTQSGLTTTPSETTTSSQVRTTPTTTAPQSTTTTTSAQSCTYTGTTTGGSTAAEIQADIIPLFQQMSNMTMSYSGTYNGNSFSESGSYQVVSTSASGGVTTYKVNVDFNAGSYPAPASASVGSNGNVNWFDEFGNNPTGTNAENGFLGYMAPFLVEGAYKAQVQAYTGSGFTSSAKGPQTIGDVTLQVTEYTLKTTPESFTSCGVSGTLDTFQLNLGQTGSFTIVSYLQIAGTVNGESVNLTIQVTWLASS